MKEKQKFGFWILANKYKLPSDTLLELVQLSDLVRITGVGPVFARIIFDSGITLAGFVPVDKDAATQSRAAQK